MSIPLLAQVSPVAFSDSKDVVPAFDSSGAITLPAARLKVDVVYPRGKKERREMTVVYDPRTGHFLWHTPGPNPNNPDDAGLFLKVIKAGGAVSFADSTALVNFIFGSGLGVKAWRGRANSLDGAVAESIKEIQQGLGDAEGRGHHRDYTLVPVFGRVPGFSEKPPPGYKPIPAQGFVCEPFNSFCPTDKNTIASISKQGNNWRLVLRNRYDVEVIVDQGFNLVSAQQLTQPKQ